MQLYKLHVHENICIIADNSKHKNNKKKIGHWMPWGLENWEGTYTMCMGVILDICNSIAYKMNALKVLTLAACMMGIAQCTELKLFPACMHAPAALIMAIFMTILK